MPTAPSFNDVVTRAKDAAHVITTGAKHMVARTLPHPLYRWYRKRRVARQIFRYSPRVVTHTYGGRRLEVLLSDPLAEGWYDGDSPRLSEVEELVRIGALRPGTTVFDVGAHQGVVALMLAGEVGSSGRVIAVEAEPHNVMVARRNVELNNASNISVIHAAIADRPGRLYFAEGLNGHVDADTRVGNVEVEAVTIDQLAQEHGHPDLVFLDVEGYEGKALEGATATLRSRRTSFLVEVHASWLVDCAVSDLVDHFAG
jgi:FkbM family methyltransferase